MKILSKLAIVASLACVGAMAQGAFVGVELGINKTQLKDNDGDKFKSKAKPAIGFKGGYDFDIAKIYGQYSYKNNTFKFTLEDDGDKAEYKLSLPAHQFLIGADFTPNITESLKGIVGFGVGYNKSNGKLSETIYDKNTQETSQSSAKAKFGGAVVLAKLGLAYSLDEHNELEFAYKFEKTKYKLKIADEEADKVKGKGKSNYFGVGYNYKF